MKPTQSAAVVGDLLAVRGPARKGVEVLERDPHDLRARIFRYQNRKDSKNSSQSMPLKRAQTMECAKNAGRFSASMFETTSSLMPNEWPICAWVISASWRPPRSTEIRARLIVSSSSWIAAKSAFLMGRFFFAFDNWHCPADISGALCATFVLCIAEFRLIGGYPSQQRDSDYWAGELPWLEGT